jgi:hypothetical protein
MIRIVLFIASLCSSILVYGQDSTESIIITDGFYGKGWEYSEFFEIQNDNLYKSGTGWLRFSDTLMINDSTKKLLKEIPNHKHVYMKMEAIKRTGGNYGHLGASKIEFEVIRIIDLDSTYTMDDFLDRRKK